MSDGPSHQELVQQAIYDMEVPRRPEYHPPKMSYKKNKYDRSDLEDGSKIGFKTIVILSSTNRMEVSGYLMAEVIDWMHVNEGYFDARTTFIVRVLEVSRPSMQEHVGRLRTCGIETHWMYGGFKIVNLGRGIWPSYQVRCK